MHRYVNCIANESSNCSLLIGKEKTAVFDCGMAYCANETKRMIKKAINGRNLDYIFITHTHYDHVGALPYFRKEWPHVRLVASDAGARVLEKETPRKVFREMSVIAAKMNDISFNPLYDDNAFHADIVIKENDELALGDLSVKMLETPGHTKDSVSYLIPELELLILSETTGVLMSDGDLYPCYLSSFADTVTSIEKCRRIGCKNISLPHRGVVRGGESIDYFNKALAASMSCRDFILELASKGLSVDEMVEGFDKRYGTETLLRCQPKEAFLMNARATIACTLRERQ